jgi:hypothetical protein
MLHPSLSPHRYMVVSDDASKKNSMFPVLHYIILYYIYITSRYTLLSPLTGICWCSTTTPKKDILCFQSYIILYDITLYYLNHITLHPSLSPHRYMLVSDDASTASPTAGARTFCSPQTWRATGPRHARRVSSSCMKYRHHIWSIILEDKRTDACEERHGIVANDRTIHPH